MRKLIVSMNCSLDGFLSGPQCEMDWHFKLYSPDVGDALCRELQKADTVLMGRTTYEVFSRFANPAKQLEVAGRDNFPFFDMLNRYEKIVFSKTLQQACWQHSSICRAATRLKILQLKKQPGKNIMLYGSAKLLYALQPLDLIDAYQLYIHPIALGKGKPLFANIQCRQAFNTVSVEQFSSGIVLINLQRND